MKTALLMIFVLSHSVMNYMNHVIAYIFISKFNEKFEHHWILLSVIFCVCVFLKDVSSADQDCIYLIKNMVKHQYCENYYNLK